MEIRRATTDDAGSLARVHVDAWRAAYRGLVPDERLANLSYARSEERFRRSLAEGAEETYVAGRGRRSGGLRHPRSLPRHERGPEDDGRDLLHLPRSDALAEGAGHSPLPVRGRDSEGARVRDCDSLGLRRQRARDVLLRSSGLRGRRCYEGARRRRAARSCPLPPSASGRASLSTPDDRGTHTSFPVATRHMVDSSERVGELKYVSPDSVDHLMGAWWPATRGGGARPCNHASDPLARPRAMTVTPSPGHTCFSCDIQPWTPWKPAHSRRGSGGHRAGRASSDGAS
jgi:hypothetical protein